ncbi:hypothetical protein BDN70DRAFT_924193 [Pholiota conissans]|uniref:DUF8205 domain-containing protein n=1 Tax=Pholiota conissans TaxID=109636 RepID=A0A9P5YU28_9AGAR|nr:hypothetical protein BDN70DRAFT_924193 [Pholiota conissans]
MAASREQETKRALMTAATLKITHPQWMSLEESSAWGMPWNIDNQPSDDIKQKMKTSINICGYCQAVEEKGKPHKTCGRFAKHARIASLNGVIQCQAGDWREHKISCGDNIKQKRFHPLMKALLANIDSMAYLKIAAVLYLNLLDTVPLAEPWSLLVHLGVEPENILDFARLRGDIGPTWDSNSSEKIMGMLQVNAILPCPESLLDKNTKIRIAQSKRAKADSDGFTWESPVGVMVFQIGDSLSTLQVPILIVTYYMDMARSLPSFTRTIMATNTSSDQPMTITSCIELVVFLCLYINTTIRLDKANRCSLRTEMTAEDKTIIEHSGAKSALLTEKTCMAIVHLRERMCRDACVLDQLSLEINLVKD